MAEYRLLIGGDSQQWRESIKTAFINNGSGEVIGSATTDELLYYASITYPDVVLWKLELDDPEYIINKLHTECPFTILILIVDNPNNYDLFNFLQLGVKGCLPVRLLPIQIIDAIELIVSAGIICFPRLNNNFFYNTKPNINFDKIDLLTARENEILMLLAQQVSNQEMADKLFVSVSTIKAHLRNIFRKLNIKNRNEALRLVNELELKHTDYMIYKRNLKESEFIKAL